MIDRERQQRVAKALGDAPVFSRHVVGELEPLTLREYLAELRVSVPVTALAKWKTFLQLLAVGFLIAGEAGDLILPVTSLIGIALLWLSALLTLYTGWDYFRAGVRHLIKD